MKQGTQDTNDQNNHQVPWNKGKLIGQKSPCWRRLKIDHPYRLKIDQGKLLYSVLYSIEIVDQTELVLNLFFY